MEDHKETYFSVDSRLLFQLGEKLVADRVVALAELVKNSYDADATHVVVRMQQVKTKGGMIVVEDNGTGIAPATFEQTWMRIATIDKELNPISARYNRQKAGEKGIGRFACRRLSEILEFESVAEDENGQKHKLTATFKWEDFLPGSDVNGIPILLFTDLVQQDTPTGTTLRLKQTTEPWSAPDIRRLKQELMDLISPTFKAELDIRPETYDPGFRIDLKCPEFPMEVEPLDKTFFRNAWAKLSASVDSTGLATYHLETTEGIKYQLDKEFVKEEAFRYLRDTRMEAYIFSYRSDFFRYSDWRMSQSRKVGDERGGIKVYADQFRVFGYGAKGDDWLGTVYDRARSLITLGPEVAPYTEEGVRPGLALFRNNNLFGYVVFSRASNKMLEITVNRDRITSNEAFEELRKFARLGIDFATVFYANQIAREKREEIERRRAREEALQKALEEARRRVEEAMRKAEDESRKAEEEERRAKEEINNAELEARRATNNKIDAEQVRREAEEERRNIEENLRRAPDSTDLRNALESALANEKVLLEAEKTAIEAERKAHEHAESVRVRSEEKLTAYIDEAKKAEEETRRAEEARKKADEEELKLRKEKLQREFILLRVLASTGTLVLIFEHELQALIDDMEEMLTSASAVRAKMPDNEQEAFQIVLDSFGNRTEMVKELGDFLGLTMGAESRSEKRDWVVFPIVAKVFSPFRWYLEEYGISHINTVPKDLRTPRMYRSELVSVLHNLMTNAIKAVRGGHSRRIEVTGFKENGVVHIQFLDTGRGLDRSKWEVVFEPFESYSEPDIRFGVGTGLGLKIVRDIIRAYGGEAQFSEPPDGWSTCVEITLPAEE
jgi:signal transduction histidine kinase